MDRRKSVILTLVSTIAFTVFVLEQVKQVNRVGSFEAIGGRAVYQKQRLEFLRRQLNTLDIVHDERLREQQKSNIQREIDEIAGNSVDELGEELKIVHTP